MDSILILDFALDCYPLVKLNSNLSFIDRATLPKYDSPRGKYYRLSFNLVMRFDTLIKFSLEYEGMLHSFITYSKYR